MAKIYRGKGGKFASKEEIARQKADEAKLTNGQLNLQQAETPKVVKAYKGFYEKEAGKPSCRNFVFEIKKEYTVQKPVRACSHGFHASPSILSTFSYYPPQASTVYGKVELSGELAHDYHYNDEAVKKFQNKSIDKLAAEKIVVEEILHPSHVINTIAQEIDQALIDKHNSVDYARVKDQFALNNSQSPYRLRYMVQTENKSDAQKGIVMPNFYENSDNNVLFSNVFGGHFWTRTCLQYLSGLYQHAINDGGSAVWGGSHGKLTMNSRGAVDVWGKNNAIIAWLGAKVRFRQGNVGNSVTFVDPTSNQIKIVKDTDADFIVGKWMSFTSVGRTVYETKFVVE